MIEQPTKETVLCAVKHWQHYAMMAPDCPTWEPAEWQLDHSYFIIGRILPILRPDIMVYRIAVEAYLAGMEPVSDGSSVVPDAARYGRIKDWQGVMHDYIFWLHHVKLSDAFGHVWTLAEANAAYRHGWVVDGQRFRGNVWWLGLTVGSWAIWKRIQP
jgi:hypothetical protein